MELLTASYNDTLNQDDAGNKGNTDDPHNGEIVVASLGVGDTEPINGVGCAGEVNDLAGLVENKGHGISTSLASNKPTHQYLLQVKQQ